MDFVGGDKQVEKEMFIFLFVFMTLLLGAVLVLLINTRSSKQYLNYIYEAINRVTNINVI
jgi:hypothetical protein